MDFRPIVLCFTFSKIQFKLLVTSIMLPYACKNLMLFVFDTCLIIFL